MHSLIRNASPAATDRFGFGYYLQVGRIKRKIKKNQFNTFTKGVKIKKKKKFRVLPSLLENINRTLKITAKNKKKSLRNVKKN